jgi:uncharacterized protein YutE (UPF0331/DUF86 family)
MKKEKISLLLGYMESQEEEIDKILSEIREINPETKEKTVYLAYNLHNLYNAFEDLFREIAKIFENEIENLDYYYKELLKRMTIEISGIRPKILSKESYAILDELRGFRHIFRHAYTYEIIPEKIEFLKDKLLRNWDLIKRDLYNFKSWLKSLL